MQARQHEDGNMTQEVTAVDIVDHGSRREASNSMLQDFVDLYRCDLQLIYLAFVNAPIVS